jgi:hypothetical protein
LIREMYLYFRAEKFARFFSGAHTFFAGFHLTVSFSLDGTVGISTMVYVAWLSKILGIRLVFEV